MVIVMRVHPAQGTGGWAAGRSARSAAHLALVSDSRLMRSVAPWSEWNASRMVSIAWGLPPGAACKMPLYIIHCIYYIKSVISYQ